MTRGNPKGKVAFGAAQQNGMDADPPEHAVAALPKPGVGIRFLPVALPVEIYFDAVALNHDAIDAPFQCNLPVRLEIAFDIGGHAIQRVCGEQHRLKLAQILGCISRTQVLDRPIDLLIPLMVFGVLILFPRTGNERELSDDERQDENDSQTVCEHWSSIEIAYVGRQASPSRAARTRLPVILAALGRLDFPRHNFLLFNGKPSRLDFLEERTHVQRA